VTDNSSSEFEKLTFLELVGGHMWSTQSFLASSLLLRVCSLLQTPCWERKWARVGKACF